MPYHFLWPDWLLLGLRGWPSENRVIAYFPTITLPCIWSTKLHRLLLVVGRRKAKMHAMQCCSDLGSATGHFISYGMIFGARGNTYQAKSNYKTGWVIIWHCYLNISIRHSVPLPRQNSLLTPWWKSFSAPRWYLWTFSLQQTVEARLYRWIFKDSAVDSLTFCLSKAMR